jgi:hypothetical protein
VANNQVTIHPGCAPRPGTFQGISIREDSVYTNHTGEEDKGIRKRAEKVLAKLEEPLRRLIQGDETILYVANCLAPVSAFEQLTMGWYIYRATMSVVVLTNRRLLHLLVKGNGEWKKVLRSLSWGDLEEGKVKGWLHRALNLKYRNGKKERYWNFRGGDGKKIAMLIPAIQTGGGLERTAAEGMVSLCPKCFSPLTPRDYRCPQCGIAFKDEGTLVRRSLLIPGGGYFYVGHWLLGIGDFIAEAFLLIVFISLLLAGFAGETAQLGSAVFVGILLALEKWMTIHHCRRFVREFIPIEK